MKAKIMREIRKNKYWNSHLNKRKLTSKQKFMKMYNQIPKQARIELVYDFTSHPMTLSVCYFEIKNNTKLGDRILKRLGYEDD